MLDAAAAIAGAQSLARAAQEAWAVTSHARALAAAPGDDVVPVAALLREYAERLRTLLERGRDSGELDAHVDIEAAATLFVGSIQGLVIQALFAGDVQAIQRNAPGVFATYLRGISRGTP